MSDQPEVNRPAKAQIVRKVLQPGETANPAFALTSQQPGQKLGIPISMAPPPQPRPKGLRNAALIFFALALIPTAAIAYFVHRDVSEVGSTGPTGHLSGKSTEGDSRFALLEKLTHAYVASHSEASAAVKNGTELAPVDYLNEQLAAQGARWRVRSFEGLVADTFNVT